MVRKIKKQIQPMLTWKQVLARRKIQFDSQWCRSAGILTYQDLLIWCEVQNVHAPNLEDVRSGLPAPDLDDLDIPESIDQEAHMTTLVEFDAVSGDLHPPVYDIDSVISDSTADILSAALAEASEQAELNSLSPDEQPREEQILNNLYSGLLPGSPLVDEKKSRKSRTKVTEPKRGNVKTPE
jgi:hypothetical protein